MRGPSVHSMWNDPTQLRKKSNLHCRSIDSTDSPSRYCRYPDNRLEYIMINPIRNYGHRLGNMKGQTAQLILEAGAREPTQRLRLGNNLESPAPTTVADPV